MVVTYVCFKFNKISELSLLKYFIDIEILSNLKIKIHIKHPGDIQISVQFVEILYTGLLKREPCQISEFGLKTDYITKQGCIKFTDSEESGEE